MALIPGDKKIPPWLLWDKKIPPWLLYTGDKKFRNGSYTGDNILLLLAGGNLVARRGGTQEPIRATSQRGNVQVGEGYGQDALILLIGQSIGLVHRKKIN